MGNHRRDAEARSQSSGAWNQGGGANLRLCEKLRVVTHCFAKVHESWLPKPATRWVPQWGCSLSRNVVTKVRTDQARNSAMLRIVTGRSLFSKTRAPGEGYGKSTSHRHSSSWAALAGDGFERVPINRDSLEMSKTTKKWPINSGGSGGARTRNLCGGEPYGNPISTSSRRRKNSGSRRQGGGGGEPR